MLLSIEIDREYDGRWIAEIDSLPGVLAYGDSINQAIEKVATLARSVMADRLEHGEDQN